MEKTDTVTALAALAQENRLDVFRLLVQAGPNGLAAGAVAEKLISVKREGRSLIYAARYETMNGLLAYLTENCCGGVSECAPAACAPKSFSRKTNKAKVPA